MIGAGKFSSDTYLYIEGRLRPTIIETSCMRSSRCACSLGPNPPRCSISFSIFSAFSLREFRPISTRKSLISVTAHSRSCKSSPRVRVPGSNVSRSSMSNAMNFPSCTRRFLSMHRWPSRSAAHSDFIHERLELTWKGYLRTAKPEQPGT